MPYEEEEKKKKRGIFAREVKRGRKGIGRAPGRGMEDVERSGRENRRKRDRWKERRAEERRNQRHTRGHDANPLRSLEAAANVTVVQQRLRVEPEQRKHNGGDVEAAAISRRTDSQ